MFTRLIGLLLVVGAWLNQPLCAQSVTYFSVPTAQPVTISSGGRGPDGSVAFHRSAFIYPATDMAQGGIPNGSVFNSLSFHIATPGTAPATGTFRLWLVPTTDPNYARSDTWATLLTAPTPMVKVYDGPLTIPAQPGWYEVGFNTGASLPAHGAGTGYYVAYEWEATMPAPTSTVYTIFFRPVSLYLAVGAAPAPVLASAGGSRPWLRFGVGGGALPFPDPAVVAFYALGRLPLVGGVAVPDSVEALVTNNGTQTASAVPVVLTVSGPGAFSHTVVLPTLAPGDTARVRFAGFTPVAVGGYYARVALGTTPDSVLTNNQVGDSVLVTAAELSYARGTAPGRGVTQPVGFNDRSGTMLHRYALRRPARVTAARAWLDSRANNLGRTVFGVVLDSAGTLLGRSADHVIQPADLGDWLTLPLAVPVTVADAFFVGLAQPASVTGAGFFPLGSQAEPVARRAAYYYAAGDSALLGLRRPTEIRTLGRLLLGATLTNALGTGEDAPSANRQRVAMSLYPNPATGEVFVQLTGRPGPSQLAVHDLTGRCWRHANVAGAGVVRFALQGLPTGIYLVTSGNPITGQQLASSRLVVN